ncbi:MAG: hypothetical protein EOP04_06090, partial [Proteobacteria bacterium]
PGNERSYQGDWLNDVKEGQGTTTWDPCCQKSWKSFSGFFKNGIPNGNGRYVYANDDVYIGPFVNGYEEGEGVQHKADGSKLAGLWVKGKRQGNFAFIDKAGKKFSLTFVDDIMTLSVPL